MGLSPTGCPPDVDHASPRGGEIHPKSPVDRRLRSFRVISPWRARCSGQCRPVDTPYTPIDYNRMRPRFLSLESSGCTAFQLVRDNTLLPEHAFRIPLLVKPGVHLVEKERRKRYRTKVHGVVSCARYS